MGPALLFHVEPSSGVPIYRQLMDQVARLAASGRIADGEYLPSVRQVAESLQVNPMTVSKAYSLLERDGVLELVRGQGMRLRSRAPRTALRERLAELDPLLDQVAARALQLAITPEQALEQLRRRFDHIAKENPDGR